MVKVKVGKAKRRNSGYEITRMRQKKIIVALLENTGKTISSEARKLGYKEGYIKSGSLTKTKTWQDLMEEYLPDEKLSRIHGELLDAQSIDHYIFPTKMTDEKISETFAEFGFKVMKIIKNNSGGKRAYFSIPDNTARAKALQMAYELKQKYGEDPFKHKFARYSKGEIVEFIIGRITRNGGGGGILGDQG